MGAGFVQAILDAAALRLVAEKRRGDALEDAARLPGLDIPDQAPVGERRPVPVGRIAGAGLEGFRSKAAGTMTEDDLADGPQPRRIAQPSASRSSSARLRSTPQR